MIPRYTRAEMGRVWSDENKFQKWLDVELAATETLAEAGIVPREAALKLRERARIDVARINEIEAKVRHDVIAFTICGAGIGRRSRGGALAASTGSRPMTWWTRRKRCWCAKRRS